MAKAYRIPDYKKMYPEAGEEVIAVLRTTERKMQYQEYDLKTEQTVINQENQTITTIPSREDSLERLVEQKVQFAGSQKVWRKPCCADSGTHSYIRQFLYCLMMSANW